MARWNSYLLALACAAAAASTGADVEVLFLHTNDMHSRFEQTSQMSSKCFDAAKCYGGFARVAHEVRAARRRARERAGPPVLFLNAGDTFQGTVWYTIHKWNISSKFINMLRPDAISLGNHEFDDGVEGLVPFIDTVRCPVLAANVDASLEPALQATHLSRSVVLQAGGAKVGVVGYLTPETKNISQTGRVKITDEVVAIRAETEKLRAAGVNILVAVGHSGFDVDLRIAREVPLLDLVIGGHTNTFLYNGTKPDSEDPHGIYPTVVKQPTGRLVPVVQAYAYTKYLGHLTMVFDEDGEAKSFVGNPILLNSSVPQDEDVLEELAKWKVSVDEKAKLKVGTTKVLLEGDANKCRMDECNAGNLIADAFVAYNARLYRGPGWTDAAIAVQHGGGIRNSIDASHVNGVVTMEDLINMLPYDNKIVILGLNGSQVLKMLEWSVYNYDPEGKINSGAFLQFSGLKVTYNISQPRWKRVSCALARCSQCRVPKFSPVEPSQAYSIIVPQFLANGGDGYTLSQGSFNRTEHDYTDLDVMADYLSRKSPVYPGLEERITFCPSLTTVRRQQKAAASSLDKTVYILVFCVLFLMTSK